MAFTGEDRQRPLAQATRLLERDERPRLPTRAAPNHVRRTRPAAARPTRCPAPWPLGSRTNAKSTMPLPTASASWVDRPISNRVAQSGNAACSARIISGRICSALCSVEPTTIVRPASASRQAQRGVVDLDDPASLGQHPLALVGEAHVPPVAFEELALEAALEQPHVLAQRRLTDVAHRGGLAEPAALGDRDQRAQVFKVERVGHVSIRTHRRCFSHDVGSRPTTSSKAASSSTRTARGAPAVNYLTRRTFMRLTAAAPLWTNTADPGPIVKPLPEDTFIVHGTNAEMRWEALAGVGNVVPVDRFFVRNHTRTPLRHADTWRLQLFGTGLRRAGRAQLPGPADPARRERSPRASNAPATAGASSPASRARRCPAPRGGSARWVSRAGVVCRWPRCCGGRGCGLGRRRAARGTRPRLRHRRRRPRPGPAPTADTQGTEGRPGRVRDERPTTPTRPRLPGTAGGAGLDRHRLDQVARQHRGVRHSALRHRGTPSSTGTSGRTTRPRVSCSAGRTPRARSNYRGTGVSLLDGPTCMAGRGRAPAPSGRWRSARTA